MIASTAALLDRLVQAILSHTVGSRDISLVPYLSSSLQCSRITKFPDIFRIKQKKVACCHKKFPNCCPGLEGSIGPSLRLLVGRVEQSNGE